ncbi:Multidrug resistance protein MdtN [Legionella massiliensis]|uniref:Multidrug resistance protein MdtN n=1 Tax=Legionella massiliensis TaxID=1034943 RepID=A0A078KQ84_9GAMM|nr:HlyD family efflux transporter periplasmic adaptor subunit [Legionella massiliensis]CDZ76535.1 Multidrug resistance protein MdtN [Legionella massiliensis]CEE12273.1 Multidrug resistance protein MdtN [Legionella massiliensis]
MSAKYCSIILILAMFVGCWSSDNVKTYQGYVEGENVYLASPYSGILKKLLVSRGEHVQRGQLLFILDQNPQELIVKQGEANLLQANKVLNDLEQPRRTPEIEAIKAQIEQADAEMKLAEIRVNRYVTLLEKNAVDKDTVDAMITRYREQKNLKEQYEQNLQLARLGSRDEQIKAQEAQVISLTARLNEVKWQLAQKTMKAPDDGFIFDTYFREGEFVPDQQAVLSLLPPQYVRIEFFIPLDKLAAVHRGQLIHFNCDGCKDKNEAEINYISPEAQYIPPLVYSRDNSDKLVFRIRAQIKNPEGFKPGQPVSVILR